MSITPQALERSVLEGKERDELAAIAEAMGVKASPRASKSTLIDHILREAGIETAEERPKRTRRSSASANPGNGAAAALATPTATATAREETPVVPADNSADKSASTEERVDAAPDPFSRGDAPDLESQSRDARPDLRDAVATNNGEESPDSVESSSTGQEAQIQQGHQKSGPAQPDERPRERDYGEQRSAGNEASAPTPPVNSAQGGMIEPGNRRGRRRRGRDRGDRDVSDRGGSQETQFQGEPIPAEGLLDLREEGYGFLRTSGFLAGPRDVYVSLSQVRRFALRKGDVIQGASRPAGSSEKYPALVRIDTINGMTPDEARQRPKFEDLTPLFPDEKLRLEVPGEPNNMVARIVDLISPIGKGQRGLIVSPPKAGKTTVLKQIAHSIEANNPEVHLMVLLVDERPEEVTDMRRSVKGEVVASTFDRPSDEHTQVAELALERAKRMVEVGKDVVIVLDGITRLARAYNLAAPTTGRIMSGGIDTGALYPPKKFFGSARNIEEGGSLTILATALVETGSRMDEVIFEEFKGTGNMELRLDRKLAERRIYPALDVNGSSTRHEELLFDRVPLQQVWKLRRVLNALEGGAGLELLMDKIRSTKSNDEFLAEIAKAPASAG
ncbi:MAG TPA: transcription termination factor Rho [Acidimicrobiales bacterium]|nr:transcription termination factor Rho [Acidimicrobiales bacterium]